jgi:hypothetical protein
VRKFDHVVFETLATGRFYVYQRQPYPSIIVDQAFAVNLPEFRIAAVGGVAHRAA